jgi:hypothetical protein
VYAILKDHVKLLWDVVINEDDFPEGISVDYQNS